MLCWWWKLPDAPYPSQSLDDSSFTQSNRSSRPPLLEPSTAPNLCYIWTLAVIYLFSVGDIYRPI
jgi:hypothetical protein